MSSLRQEVKTMADIKLTINGIECTAPEGSTILQAADKNGIHIPRLIFRAGPCICIFADRFDCLCFCLSRIVCFVSGPSFEYLFIIYGSDPRVIEDIIKVGLIIPGRV